MGNISRIWLVLVISVSLGLTSLWVAPAKAAPLTTVDYATFSGWLGPVVAPPLTSVFDFEPSGGLYPGPDGEVVSVVYSGIGPVANLYVYVYQIKHYSSPPSSERKVDGISFDLFGPWAVPGVLNPGTVAFQVAGTGDKSLSDATITPGLPGIPPSISFSLLPPDFLPPGKTTWLFGFFSPMPPTTTIADVKDTGRTLLSPQVYTPTPEPSTFVLLGMGLLGGIWWRRRLK
ncbi:MAG: PEP-CTERM sorting domain-containing protein [Armatimonadetes bacterium]|nr:PEP-CTERM sorting domain-containing protein [Armatimonadota bacterium]